MDRKKMRAFVLICTLAVLLAQPVTASAASYGTYVPETEYYEFEYFPAVSEFSDSFDSELDSSDSKGYARYLLEDFVPEGSYRILLFEGSNLYFDFGVFDIVYAPFDDSDYDLRWHVSGKDYSDFKISLELYSDSSASTSIFSYTRWGYAHFPDLDLPSSSIRLVPVGSSSYFVSGSIPEECVSLFKKLSWKVAIPKDYVFFRAGENEYLLASGDLSFEGGVFEAESCDVYRLIVDGESASWSVRKETGFSLTPFDALVYSNLGHFPDLIDRSEVYSLATLLLLVIALCMYLVNGIFNGHRR